MKNTFSPGGRLQITGVGDFFRLLATVNPVTVEFYYQGREIAERLDVEAGFAEQFSTIQFDRVDITSATAQTVQFETALGSEIRYDRGSASISGTVGLDTATLLALEQINVRPEANTAFWNDTSATAVNTPLTVFTPASNTNGVILQSAFLNDQCAVAAAMQVFIAKASAPTAITDGQVLLQAVQAASSPSCILVGQLAQQQFIPAGLGLYFIANVANSSTPQVMRSARWRTL